MSQYDAERKAEHATLGDSYRAIKRDPDAFEAGAQYALDSILRAVEDFGFSALAGEVLDNEAARILRRVNDGEPQ